MKYRLFFFAVVFCCSAGHGQITTDRAYDFSRIDLTKIDPGKVQQQIDSVFVSSRMDSLFQLYSYVKNRKGKYSRSASMRYVAFTIGYQASLASLSELNDGLRATGFDEISETVGGIPWGVDLKTRRWMLTYFLAPGLKKTTSNTNFELDVRTIGMDLIAGFDIINRRSVQFYPQLGLSMQDYNIYLRQKNVTNIGDAYDMIAEPAGTQAEKRSFLLTYSGQLDVQIVRGNGGGLILGLRYGLSSDLTNKAMMVNDKKSSYVPSDRIRPEFFAAVLKLYIEQ